MFQVQHYRKIHTPVGLMNVTAHNMRHRVYEKDGTEIENPQMSEKWYDPTMAGFNRYDKDIEKPEQILKKRSDRIQEAQLIRKPQKNAAVAIEGVFSASPEFAQEWRNSVQDRKTWNEYLDKSRAWLEERFGKENILHAAVHMDEKTPHMHVLMVPIKETPKGLSYSSSTMLGGTAGLRQLHTDYHKKIGKEYDLSRGIEGSRKPHKWVQGLWEKEKEIEKNRHLLSKNNPIEEYQTPKKGLHNPLRTWVSADGQKEFSTWKEVQRYDREQHYLKTAETAELQKNHWEKRSKDAEYAATKWKERALRYEQMTPEELKKLALDKENKIRLDREQKELAQKRSISRSRDRGRGHDDGGWGL